MPQYKLIPIEQLLEPGIPAREGMDDTKLQELAESVKEIGFIHPLAVVPVTSEAEAEPTARKSKKQHLQTSAPSRYEIVDGHRRYKVAIMLAQKVLPCLIFDDQNKAREAVKLHANLYREDLSVAEEAIFIVDLINKYDYTEEQLCRAVRQKVSWVNERIALVRGNKLVFDALRERKINLAIAKQLNRLKTDSDVSYFLSLVIQGGATAVTTSKWVNEHLGKAPSVEAPQNAAPPASAPVAEISTQLECVCCGQKDSPYNLENVWIHPWEARMIKHNRENAASVTPENLQQPT